MNESPSSDETNSTSEGSSWFSYKTVFLGFGIVLLLSILAVHTFFIFSLMEKQERIREAQENEVTIGPVALKELGVDTASTEKSELLLSVGPDAKFEGSVRFEGETTMMEGVTIKDNVGIEGKLTVSDETSMTSLELQEDLTVNGITLFEGPVTINDELSVNNNMSVLGELSVDGSLSTTAFNTENLTVDSIFTVGGRVVTKGPSPEVSAGPAAGPGGTASVDGNDIAGTVAANVSSRVTGGGGIIANIEFRRPYASSPRVVVTAVSSGIDSVYVKRSASGFSIGVNGGLQPGRYTFDYMIMQ